MSGDLISIKTRQVFREHFVGWTVRTIADEFDAADIQCDYDYQPNMPGERRYLVEQYYHTIKWSDWNDIKKIIQVYENVLNPLMGSKNAEEILTSSNTSWNNQEAKKLIYALKRDGFQIREGKIITGAGTPSLNSIKEVATHFDAKHLADQIRRIEQSVEADPALAIGTAKELVETCCRTILAERGKIISGTPDIAALTKQAFRELKLLPDNIPDQAKGSDTIKRLLSNLATISQGLAEIRNLYGTGHGKQGTYKPVSSRHAKLAVGASVTLATFLFDTHKETLK